MGRYGKMLIPLALKTKEGVRIQEMQVPLDAANGTEVDYPLEPPRGTSHADILTPAC